MFKYMLLPLLAITSLHAAEELDIQATVPNQAPIIAETETPAENATQEVAEEIVHPAAESIMRLIYHLECGIVTMEYDSNKEHEQIMRTIAADARAFLVKFMALAKMGKLADYEEGLRADLVRELYQTYGRFLDALKATYEQKDTPVEEPYTAPEDDTSEDSLVE